MVDKVLDAAQETFYRKQLLSFMDFLDEEAEHDSTNHDKLTPEQEARLEVHVSQYTRNDLHEMLAAGRRLQQEIKEVSVILALLHMKSILQGMKDDRDEAEGK